MEFVEGLKKAHEMCMDFEFCFNCPLYSLTSFICFGTLMNEPEKAEKAIIDYFRRKENATE